MQSANDPDALAQLALRHFEQGRMAAAEQNCLQALTVNRRHGLSLSVLGMILHAQGRHEDAARVFNALTVYEPNDPEHWQNLCVALRTLKRHEDALAVGTRALELGSPSASLLYDVALVHVDRCEYASALELLAQALDRAPRRATIRCAFAQCCCDLVRQEDALEALRDWRSFEGLTSDLLAQIAFLLFMMGEVRSGEQALTEACRGPQNARSSLILARVLERTNRLSEADRMMRSLRESASGDTRADPDFALAEGVLAQRRGDHERACLLLRAGLERQNDPPRRHQLLFPLAKSLDALGRCDEAFQTLEQAHRSQREYLLAITGRGHSDSPATFSATQMPCEPQDVRTWLDPGPSPEESPVFIVAFPRSGTTLLEQILDAHPLLQSMDEQPFLRMALDDVAARGVTYPTELGRLTAADLDEIRTRYWNRARARVDLRPGQRMVDKNPLNMLRLPLIRRLFPQAHIVLAIRHPCDTLLSCYMQQFRAPDLALICTDLTSLAGHYARVFDFWYAQWPLLRPESLELRYESLVADVEAETRRLADFLGLPWDDAMLAPGAHARAKPYISTPSYSQVIQPVNQGSIGRWKRYEDRFAAVLPVLAPFLERWRYEDPPAQ